jgi:hypothetical protein
MFDDHFDFLTRHELMPELVKALEADIQEVEQRLAEINSVASP